jgi:hypothetical protein
MKAVSVSMRAFVLSLSTLLALSTSASAAVWPSENTWNDQWEASYREWVHVHGKSDLFSREKNPDGTPNPYFGIRVDCADLVYSLRAIFSYENNLPFVIVNPVSSRFSTISNEITRFDSAPSGLARFRKFLPWIYDLVSTHGLARDTYSVPFTGVGSGTIILTSRKNHHSWTITNVSTTGNPTLVFNSTVGRKSGFLVQERKSWPNPYWIFEPEGGEGTSRPITLVYRPGSYAGFRYWRSPDHLALPEFDVPGYSESQFSVGIGNWKNTAQAHLAKSAETIDQVVRRLLSDACADFQQRVTAVAEAEAYKKDLATANPSTAVCLNAAQFDELSTPSRDRRFVDGLILARAHFVHGIDTVGRGGFSPESLVLYSEFFPSPDLSAAAEAEIESGNPEVVSTYCTQKIPGYGNLSLARFKHLLFRGKYSSNPNDSWLKRFGVGSSAQDRGKACPAFGLVHRVPDLAKSEADAAREVGSNSTNR